MYTCTILFSLNICDLLYLVPEFTTSQIQSNLFITDTKGTGISVHIIEVSVLERQAF